MKPKFLFIPLVLCYLFSYAQVDNKFKDARTQKIEATKLQIEKADSDSLRLKLRLKLAGQLAYFDGNIAKEIFLDVHKKIKDKGYDSYYYQKMEAELLYSMSSIFLNLQDTASALQYANEALDIATEIEYDMIVGRAISNLGNIYSRQMDFEKAKRFHKRALVFHKKANSGRGQALTLNRIGRILSRQEKADSAMYYYKKAIEVDTATALKLQIRGNLASTYANAGNYELAANIYRENLKLLDPTEYNILAHNHANLAKVYDKHQEYSKANAHIDSAIFCAKKVNALFLIQSAYHAKVGIAHNNRKFSESYEAFLIQDKYKDSLVKESTTKRFANLEFAYQYKREKELSAINLKNESTKKKLYLGLFVITALAALLLINFIRKNNKQKLELIANKAKLVEMEKVKTALALANREQELKKVVVESSVREEVLNSTIDDIKQVTALVDGREHKSALRSISASLLSEKDSKMSSLYVHKFLDEVNIDFKILLDQQFPELKPKEKELLCLMKMELSTTEISKLQNNSVASVKSLRYRIRKKLGLSSEQDIIAFIESKNIML
ncbi:tetratricopeptide repeat protein [Aquimarina sp. D1M17]|uniref:tetratricopeptide repeat protein n=1 Tax=Aquimarina acroporae TaxID=2937283 RepID=UPI0020C0CF31|nr:tetratricopeptide repeat protein [Aquimarina acroporae]MCK8521029.1 tetratricopeptide repeat protein [Aquimarina acroporae]